MNNAVTIPDMTLLRPVHVRDLPGWAFDDHGAALASFQRSCMEILAAGKAFERPVAFGGTRKHWFEVCRRAMTADEPQRFFERNFAAFSVKDPMRPEGLFTGYYEPEVEGSRVQAPGYRVPVYRKPDDLVALSEQQQQTTGMTYGRVVNGDIVPYHTRQEIEVGALSGRGLEILWLKDWSDAFFLQVQGSGRVRFPDDSLIRLEYAAKSGLPYTSIGSRLVARGVMSPQEMSMQVIRDWMNRHPEDARYLMWENQSFIFFRETAVGDLGPNGAQQVPLTPGRSLAVDRSLWMLGTPVWLDMSVPSADGRTMTEFRHLTIAQDTGSAIRGHVRGDVFWGAGEDAALIAGRMKSAGSMTILLPNKLAETLAGGL